MVFPTFLNLNLNFAIRSPWSKPQSAPGFVFANSTEFFHLQLQRIKSIWFWYWPSGHAYVYSCLLCCWKKVFVVTSAFSWQNSVSLCPVLQDQTCLLLQISLDFLLFQSSPLWWKYSAAQLIAQAGQQAAAQLKVYPSQKTAKQKKEKKDPQVVIAFASTSYCLLIVSLLPCKGWDQFPHRKYWCLIPYTY